MGLGADEEAPTIEGDGPVLGARVSGHAAIATAGGALEGMVMTTPSSPRVASSSGAALVDGH